MSWRKINHTLPLTKEELDNGHCVRHYAVRRKEGDVCKPVQKGTTEGFDIGTRIVIREIIRRTRTSVIYFSRIQRGEEC
jgi:hypothetical protein